MPTAYGYVLAALWLGCIGYWIASASKVKAAARSENWQSRIAYSAPLWIAAVLLLGRGMNSPLASRFIPDLGWNAPLGVVLTAAGLAFAIWARLHFGCQLECGGYGQAGITSWCR
jgi:hypothetical protein